MSTRAHIRIVDGDELFQLYHHSDGYPEGVGRDLKKFLKDTSKSGWWYGETIANEIVKGKVFGDTGYEITSCYHGDEEYVYVIDCGKKELKCYKTNLAEDVESVIDKVNEIELNGRYGAD